MTQIQIIELGNFIIFLNDKINLKSNQEKESHLKVQFKVIGPKIYLYRPI